MYPQVTLAALNSGKRVTTAASITAYIGVVKAFSEYLAKYNNGRGFVLLGHSQGALILEQLIKGVIDPNPALRRRLVSADPAGRQRARAQGATRRRHVPDTSPPAKPPSRRTA